MVMVEFAKRKNWVSVQHIHNSHKWIDGDEYRVHQVLPRDAMIAEACKYPLIPNPVNGGYDAPDNEYICLSIKRNAVKAESAKTEAMRIQKDFGLAQREAAHWERQLKARWEAVVKELQGKLKDDATADDVKACEDQAWKHDLVKQASDEADAANERLDYMRKQFKICEETMRSATTEFYVIPFENLEMVHEYGIGMNGTRVEVPALPIPPLEK